MRHERKPLKTIGGFTPTHSSNELEVNGSMFVETVASVAEVVAGRRAAPLPRSYALGLV